MQSEKKGRKSEYRKTIGKEAEQTIPDCHSATQWPVKWKKIIVINVTF